MKNNGIKVGSEWVKELFGEEQTVKVVHVCEHGIIIQWPDGSKGLYSEQYIIADFKPKPVERVVWMNVYEHSAGGVYNTKEEADDCSSQGRLFCQRVVIKDNNDE